MYFNIITYFMKSVICSVAELVELVPKRTTTKSYIAVSKKADRTAHPPRPNMTRGIATKPNRADNPASGIAMVTRPRSPWLFQIRQFRLFGSLLCVVAERYILRYIKRVRKTEMSRKLSAVLGSRWCSC